MSTQTATAGPAADPGEVRVHLTLAWDEAQRGCTRVVEVDGRLEWLDIPAGAADGQEICFPGRGEAVPADSRHGDLWVTLEVAPEPIPGEEVGVKLEVSPLEALTGGKKTVEVNGRLVWVRIPPNITAGQVIRMKGEGGEGENGGPRGDLVVVLEIASSLTIPEFEPDEETLALATPAAVVRYQPTPPPTGSRILWPIATAAAAATVGGVALFLLGRTNTEASPQAGPAPLPAITQPAAAVPAPATPDPAPAPTPAPPKPTPKRAAARPEPAEPRVERPAPRPAPQRRAARVPRAFRPPVRREPIRAVRPAPAPQRTASRFCGRCGRRIAGGSFCGGCGRKI
jgi:hypothetical protein